MFQLAQPGYKGFSFGSQKPSSLIIPTHPHGNRLPIVSHPRGKAPSPQKLLLHFLLLYSRAPTVPAIIVCRGKVPRREGLGLVGLHKVPRAPQFRRSQSCPHNHGGNESQRHQRPSQHHRLRRRSAPLPRPPGSTRLHRRSLHPRQR